MNPDRPPSDEPLPWSSLKRVDQLCSCFEDAWKTGQEPQIEHYLLGAAEEESTRLFQELLWLEVDYRKKHGQRPDATQYQQRFPQFKEQIAKVFRQLATTASEPPPVLTFPPLELVEGMVVTLTALEGPHQGQVFEFRDQGNFIVGRSRSAQFRLTNDSKVGRFHFLVEVNPPYCRLMDMASLNHTWVNDQQVMTHDLKHGDRIRCGGTLLLVSIHKESATAPPQSSPLAGDPTSPVKSPERFPGYVIESELGRGGMGIVYRARQTADQTVVALKTIKPVHSGTASSVRRFLADASILRNLNHPHIVGFRGIGVARGEFFFAMEFVSGSDSAALLAKNGGPLSIPRATTLMSQVLDALSYAHTHARKFVHRDVKPRNILITPSAGREIAKLTDFGLARLYHTSRFCGLSLTGGMGGTIGFMAPEQITHFHQAVAAADQYGTAATLYHWLTGQLTYDFPQRFEEKLALVLEEEPVPIRQRRADIPPALAEAIHRALQRRPEDRFPDVATFRQAVLPFAEPT